MSFVKFAGNLILLQTLDKTASCSQHAALSDNPWHGAGTFLRGALEKVGVDPNIKRIGKYKSAGDQLLRRDMSEPQREQLTAILDDLYEGFTQQTAASRGKTAQEVRPRVQEHTLGSVAVHAQAAKLAFSVATMKSVAVATRQRERAAV